ncbi:MAG: hypothetical protein VX878_05715, partial [Pseudomonadota bacterium]|nr:hypothetical protein [Pseudomonadota bacterium]
MFAPAPRETRPMLQPQAADAAVSDMTEAYLESLQLLERMHRLMLDLVKDGSTWEEIVELARRIEAAGASIINTGIGWHEARVPTI